jgi:hypothetical protein
MMKKVFFFYAYTSRNFKIDDPRARLVAYRYIFLKYSIDFSQKYFFLVDSIFFVY